MLWPALIYEQDPEILELHLGKQSIFFRLRTMASDLEVLNLISTALPPAARKRWRTQLNKTINATHCQIAAMPPKGPQICQPPPLRSWSMNITNRISNKGNSWWTKNQARLHEGQKETLPPQQGQYTRNTISPRPENVVAPLKNIIAP